MLRTRIIASLAALATAVAVVASGPPAGATTGDVGTLDQSTAGVVNPPTSDKPQSKLWYTDGFWFADMWDSPSASWHIFRLDRATEKWVDTKVVNDTRAKTLADTLWDGTHLYIASHVVAYSTESSPKAAASGNPARLYRYSYSTATKSFALDAGFPSVIGDYSSESMTIDKDSTGTIWATWTQVSGDATSGYTSAVYVNATNGSDSVWGTPMVIPVAGNAPAPDDISSVVAFGKNKIGVMWSNQLDQTVYWAVHNDGDVPTQWHGGIALRGNRQADDHLNLKSIQADPAGRVFAAVKTSADEIPGTDSSAAQILLLVFKPGTGAWSSTVFGTLADCHTRPQVVLDETHAIVHVVATAPSTTSGCPAPGTAGTIYEKSAPMDDPVFTMGRGTPIIRDAANANMNNATTSKQSVTATSGMVVLASNTSTARYWHADISLGGGADTSVPSTPTGLTAVAPTSTTVNLAWGASIDDVGVAGYRVYRNGSTTPLAALGAGTTSYSDTTVSAKTTYTYQVAAVDAAGNVSAKASASVTTPASGTGSTVLTFTPTADAYVDSSLPTTNFGAASRLSVDGSPRTNALLKFTVAGTSGCVVSSAKLRLTVGSTTTDNSPYGGDVYGVPDTTWSENAVTWNTQPAAGTTKVGSIATSVALNTSYTVVVTPLIKGDGVVSMELSTANADAARYWSKEGATAAQVPQLQVTCG